MAPTFRPYQSVGQGLNQLNLPQGAEAQEASRTMTVLSQSLDRMSNFFIKRAEEQAKIEGQKFGIENMSLEKLRQANKENRDIFDIPAFGNTVFGNSARQSALTVLENETIVEATKTINDLVFQAETNFTNPTVLRNQIDASILGFVNALSPSAPVLAQKISAQLELSGARVFDQYRSAHAKSTASEVQASSIVALLTQLDLEKGKIHGLVVNNSVNQFSVDAQREKWINKISEPTYGLKKDQRKKFETSFDEMLVSFITDKAFELVNNAGGNAYSEILKIQNATTSDENLNNLLRLRVSDSKVRKKISDDMLAVLRSKRAETTYNEQLTENRRTKSIEATKNLFSKAMFANDGLIDYEGAESAIRAMLALDTDEGNKLRDTLNSAQGGVRLDDDLGDEVMRDVLADTDTVTYEILNDLVTRKKISVATFKDLDKIADAKTSTEFTSAMATVAKNLKFNATDIKIKALDKTTKLKEQAFLDVKDKLIKARNNAIDTNTPVNLVQLAETLTKNVDENLKTALKAEQTSLFKNVMRGYFIKLQDERTQDLLGLNPDNIPNLDNLVDFGNFFIQVLEANRTNDRNLKLLNFNTETIDTVIQNTREQLGGVD